MPSKGEMFKGTGARRAERNINGGWLMENQNRKTERPARARATPLNYNKLLYERRNW